VAWQRYSAVKSAVWLIMYVCFSVLYTCIGFDNICICVYDNICMICKLLVVAGVEVASAKTQTSKLQDIYPHSDGFSTVPSQFVIGMLCSLLLR